MEKKSNHEPTISISIVHRCLVIASKSGPPAACPITIGAVTLRWCDNLYPWKWYQFGTGEDVTRWGWWVWSLRNGIRIRNRFVSLISKKIRCSTEQVTNPGAVREMANQKTWQATNLSKRFLARFSLIHGLAWVKLTRSRMYVCVYVTITTYTHTPKEWSVVHPWLNIFFCAARPTTSSCLFFE